MMIRQPEYLKKGDKIAIVCPAKKLPAAIHVAIAELESWGLEVVLGETIGASHHQFAGTDSLRASDLQRFLDASDIKAIMAARGGYGTLRIIDELNFDAFEKSPKWLIGFSDITVLLSHSIAKLNMKCLHAQMPYTFEKATKGSLESIRQVLFGSKSSFEYKSTVKNRTGKTEGLLIGGNLSILCALQGSVSEMDFNGKILFLEDVGEHEYAIDRMMRMMDRAGKLKNLSALIFGAFNEIQPEKIPFGQSAEEVLWEVVKKYDYPVCFNFPTGHIDNNIAMVLGETVTLEIEPNIVKFKYV
ncbi:muramoyltetrapeptide carboxypeptidase [Pedobacter sp. UYP30]|uniref:S66 peptidase family protein n=1 Tax=Pedobacter sp. UYP30 TaxID=1756400 RepID=UPI0033971C1C